jgi:hypothetical protein
MISVDKYQFFNIVSELSKCLYIGLIGCIDNNKTFHSKFNIKHIFRCYIQ